MRKHFVEFMSPGTFVSEITILPIDSWDVKTAVEMAKSIRERYGARPYGFRFITRKRSANELDSHVSEKSNTYYLGGRIETYAEIVIRNDPKDGILRNNMKYNQWDRVIVNENSWQFTAPLFEGDVVLDVDLRGAP